METKNKTPALTAPGQGNGGIKLSQIAESIIPQNPLQCQTLTLADELALYEKQMAEADATDDLDAWIDAWLRWNTVWPLVHLKGVK